MALATPVERAHAQQPAVELARDDLVHFSVQAGHHTPLGQVGVGVELHVLPRLVLASGLGLGASPNYDPQAAVLSRFALWRSGNAGVSAGFGFSYNGDHYQEEYLQGATVSRRWRHVVRLNPEISVESRIGRRWTARAFGGLGIVVTPGECGYSTTAIAVPCSSPDAPEMYREQPIPLLPYLGLALAASAHSESPSVSSPWFVGPWYGWQILLVDVAAMAAILGGSDSSTVSSWRHLSLYGGLALYELGGPAVHVAHKHTTRALVSFALRTVGALVTVQLARSRTGDLADHRAVELFAPMGAAAAIDWTLLGWTGSAQ